MWFPNGDSRQLNRFALSFDLFEGLGVFSPIGKIGQQLQYQQAMLLTVRRQVHPSSTLRSQPCSSSLSSFIRPRFEASWVQNRTTAVLCKGLSKVLCKKNQAAKSLVLLVGSHILRPHACQVMSSGGANGIPPKTASNSTACLRRNSASLMGLFLSSTLLFAS